MNYEVEQDPEVEFNERLRMETGWADVAGGLSRVLFGYALLVFGTALGIGLAVIALHELGLDFFKKGARGNMSYVWLLWIGISILSLTGLFSFGLVVSGQFKCLLSVSERHGARWFMVLCVACLFMGPIFQVATCISGWQAFQELRNNPAKFQEMQLNTVAQWLQMTALVVSMLYPLCFCLFLRATAVCLRVDWNVMAVNVFLLVGAGLFAATFMAMFQHPIGGRRLPWQENIMLNLGWFAMAIGYVVLIALTRINIHRVISKVKSPLQM
jgi:hypothetical protein